MKAEFSSESELDLLEISEFIAPHNVARAETFIAEIEAYCHKIALTPKAHPPREDLSPDLRMAIHGVYLIFYRETETGIRIERILHGARDYGELL